MRVLFSGGGTGGHLTPGLAVWESVRRLCGDDCDAVFLGTGRSGERATLAGAGVRHEPVYGAGRSVRDHARALVSARQVVKAFRPDVAVGLGGYASLAGAFVAKAAGVPLVLLEQNAVPGRATALLQRFARTTFRGLDYERRAAGVSGVTLGTPVRRAMADLASLPTARCGGQRKLLVLGGSQGSRVVNDLVLAAGEELQDELCCVEICHQTGAAKVDRVSAAYRRLGLRAEVRSFFDDLPERLAEGPVVVTRAGGTTLAELACAGVPAVLIPHAGSVRDHQLMNARHAERVGVRMVDESERLAPILRPLLAESFSRVAVAEAIRRLARPLAADEIAGELLGTYGGVGGARAA